MEKKYISAAVPISSNAESEIEKAIAKNSPPKEKAEDDGDIVSILNDDNINEGNAAEETKIKNSSYERLSFAGYFSAFNSTFGKAKYMVSMAYKSIKKYSKYFSNSRKKRVEKDCWQIGIDMSRTANFIFFPKKMKKITGILIDKGIMLDYINPAPAYCNF